MVLPELPLLRKMENETEFMFCRVSLIIWVTNYVHQSKRDHTHHNNLQQGHVSTGTPVHDDEGDSAHPSLDSSKFVKLIFCFLCKLVVKEYYYISIHWDVIK